MIRDFFFHPLGFACSAIWFLFVCWVVYRVFLWLFQPQPPRAA